jgi:hypothetical protein
VPSRSRAPRPCARTGPHRATLQRSINLLAITLLATASMTVATAAARSLKATDEAHMHYLKHKSTSSLLYEEGSAHGTLPGSMRAYITLGARLNADFTLYLNGGSIHGHGTATPHGGGLYESFAGAITVTGGTGRYSHAHGRAGFYGVFNRRTYALTVQTTGSLSY